MRDSRRRKILNEKAYQMNGVVLSLDDGIFLTSVINQKRRGHVRVLPDLSNYGPPRVTARRAFKDDAANTIYSGQEILNLLNEVRANLRQGLGLAELDGSTCGYRIAIRLVCFDIRSNRELLLDLMQIYYHRGEEQSLSSVWKLLSSVGQEGYLGLSRFF